MVTTVPLVTTSDTARGAAVATAVLASAVKRRPAVFRFMAPILTEAASGGEQGALPSNDAAGPGLLGGGRRRNPSRCARRASLRLPLPLRRADAPSDGAAAG